MSMLICQWLVLKYYLLVFSVSKAVSGDGSIHQSFLGVVPGHLKAGGKVEKLFSLSIKLDRLFLATLITLDLYFRVKKNLH